MHTYACGAGDPPGDPVVANATLLDDADTESGTVPPFGFIGVHDVTFCARALSAMITNNAMSRTRTTLPYDKRIEFTLAVIVLTPPVSCKMVSSSSRTCSPGFSDAPVMVKVISAPATVIAEAAPGPISVPIVPALAMR